MESNTDKKRKRIITSIKAILCSSEIQKIMFDCSLWIIDNQETLSIIEMTEDEKHLIINGYFLDTEINTNDLENILGEMIK
jgi:hypothetical protein